jgi:hypothetical protein
MWIMADSPMLNPVACPLYLIDAGKIHWDLGFPFIAPQEQENVPYWTTL